MPLVLRASWKGSEMVGMAGENNEPKMAKHEAKKRKSIRLSAVNKSHAAARSFRVLDSPFLLMRPAG